MFSSFGVWLFVAQLSPKGQSTLQRIKKGQTTPEVGGSVGSLRIGVTEQI